MTRLLTEIPDDIFGNVLFDKSKIAPCNSGIKISQELFFGAFPQSSLQITLTIN